VEFRFRGKSGVFHAVEIADRRLARIVRQMRDLPGQDLFQYVDEDGVAHGVGSSDVNDYIRGAGGADFTAKDFRTWHGTAHALALWIDHAELEKAKRPSTRELLGEVAKRLGNSVAVCRKSYVHPRVLEALAGELDAKLLASLDAARGARLSLAERRLLAFLARS